MALGAPLSTSALRGVHEGTDGGRNVRSWFVEDSGGRFRPRRLPR
jgi:hypothetical protein